MTQPAFHWDPEKGTLLLSIPRPDINPKVIDYVNEKGFVEKNEFHITILSFQNGKKIVQAIPQSDIEKVLGIARAYSWEFELIPRYFSLERALPPFILNGVVQKPAHLRRSIVQEVSVPDMEKFFADISHMTGISFESPFPHTTLFSWSDLISEMNAGIALNSQQDFENYIREELVL